MNKRKLDKIKTDLIKLQKSKEYLTEARHVVVQQHCDKTKELQQLYFSDFIKSEGIKDGDIAVRSEDFYNYFVNWLPEPCPLSKPYILKLLGQMFDKKVHYGTNKTYYYLNKQLSGS